jgi:hypothetical protein
MHGITEAVNEKGRVARNHIFADDGFPALPADMCVFSEVIS